MRSLLLAAITFAVAGCGNNAEKPAKATTTTTTTARKSQPKKVKEQEKPAALEIDAVDLFGQYMGNSVRADQDYKGKLLAVSGSVARISSSLGSPSVLLLSDGQDITGVQCLFPSNRKSDVARLNVGDKVTIVGKCAGKSINVLVRECYLK